MIKKINPYQERESLKVLRDCKRKNYEALVIRIGNTNLCTINELVDKTIFYKNDLFVDATTLFELMQPVGGRGKHNYHGLSPELILLIFKNLNAPLCILNDGLNKYAIILYVSDLSGSPMLVVIETECRLGDDEDANINKLVTMFPKEKIKKYLRTIDITKIVYLNQYKLDKIK